MGNTQSEAYAKRDAYKKQIEAGLRAEAAGVTVSLYAAQWMKTYKSNIGIRTQNEHIRELNTMIDLIGDKRLSDVVPSDIQNVYNQRAGKSASYIRHLSQTVDAMFQSAVADRLISHNPCLSVKPPKGKAGTHRAIDDWERQLILQSIGNHRFAPAVMVMLYAGLRRGEALALNIDRDVDFQSMTITVRQAVRFENNDPLIVSPKTESGERTIPMLDILASILAEQHGLLAKSANGHIMTETAFQCSWQSYISYLEQLQNGDSKRWYGRRSGQGESFLKQHPWQSVTIQPHDLRHSYCTMLYNSGIDLKTAQKWMGHADQTMTMRIYTHLTAEREAASAQKLRENVNHQILFGMQNGMQTNRTPFKTIDI